MCCCLLDSARKSGFYLILSCPTISLLVLTTTKHGEGKRWNSTDVQEDSSEEACPGIENNWQRSYLVCTAETRGKGSLPFLPSPVSVFGVVLQFHCTILSLICELGGGNLWSFGMGLAGFSFPILSWWGGWQSPELRLDILFFIPTFWLWHVNLLFVLVNFHNSLCMKLLYEIVGL